MARKKKKTGLVDEPKPERKPHIVWFDADGVEIGDDGYPMTRIRTRMHFAFLLRVEGLLCLFTALLSFCANFIGFNWMYDKRSPRAITSIIAVIGIGSILYELAALLVVHVPDPVSVVNIVFVAISGLLPM